jgi:type IX secretion system PorP/SprF family membrane protein
VRKLTLILSVLLQITALCNVKAQVDPHFSQYYANPLWLNPALTGVIDGGNMRVNSNFKDQWAGISNGFKTGSLSMDFQPYNQVGIGLSFLNQAAGTAGYNYFTANISFSYTITVSDDGFKRVHFGVQAGAIDRSFDPNKLQLDDQYNPATGFDPNLPSFENFTTTNSIEFDSSAGIFYDDTDPDGKTKLFGGVSVAHLTTEKDPFAPETINSKLPMRFTVHGGLKIRASDNVDITPHLVYIRQQSNQIKAAGVFSELKFQDNNSLILGAMYRVNDAMVADLGYRLNNTIIGFSYDFNTSPLKTATNGQGGFELSLAFVFHNDRKGPSTSSPSF